MCVGGGAWQGCVPGCVRRCCVVLLCIAALCVHPVVDVYALWLLLAASRTTMLPVHGMQRASMHPRPPFQSQALLQCVAALLYSLCLHPASCLAYMCADPSLLPLSALQVWRNERQWRSFTRSFTLPENVNHDGICAQLDKGVLKVLVPKVEQAKTKPKRITVKGEEKMA
jgi:hypothetical protein